MNVNPPILTSRLNSTLFARRREERILVDIRNYKTRYHSLTVSNEGG